MTTQTEAKKIFVLEDVHEQLEAYTKIFNRAGFLVRGAATLDEAEDILRSKETFDLLLLDLNLKYDPKALESNTYGSAVGEQFIKEQASWPPEVLTMTGYQENVDLWRRSFAIGAVALLEKGAIPVPTIINYIRVLLLRRAVSLSSPRCNEAIRAVLNKSGREHQVIEDFLRQYILPEFAACLRSPFIVALEHAGASFEEAQGARLSREAESRTDLKEELAALAAKASYYIQINGLSAPLKLDEAVFRLEDLPAGKSVQQIFFSPDLDELSETGKTIDGGEGLRGLLEDAEFIPLQLTPSVRLHLLILKDRKRYESSEDFLTLAKLLAKYSLDSLRMTLTSLIERWKHEHEIKRVQLEELGRFCQYVGAETKRITFGAESEGFVPAKNTSFHRLALLADELCGAGDFLRDLGEENLPPAQRLVLREIVLESWEGLGRGGGNRSVGMSFRGDEQATVVASKEELLFIFSRLLHWLASFYEEDEDVPQGISVECRLEGSNVELSLESDSPRLNKILRDNIFVPMTQRIDYSQVLEGKGPKLFLAMYLAKTILEKRYKGSLTDHSDELPGETGHRLILRMPVINR
jgi:CheY-like chemotaxis protein